ncbi:MAG: V-type ATPase subunit, partial [Bacillota bacterium]
LLLDRASFRQLASDIGGIDSPYLKETAEIIIDTTNIKMYMRAMLLGKPAAFIRKLLLSGGSIPEDAYLEYGGESVDAFVDAFIDKFRGSRYCEAVRKGWESCKADKSSSMLEKLMDDLLMDHIRKARMVTIGVEPVMAYLFAKETEIKNVRIIMTGRINGLPTEMIRERLRKGYV